MRKGGSTSNNNKSAREKNNGDEGISRLSSLSGAATKSEPQAHLNRKMPPKFHSENNNNEDRPLCLFFFLHHNCRYGEDCAYSHSPPKGLTYEEARGQIPCPFFAKGKCRYGEHCELMHLHQPKDFETTEASSKSNNDTDNMVCGICLENVPQIGHKFGLLSCCNHVFCVKCLMEWRKQGSEEAQDRRACPTCRKTSNWVIPSSTLPRNDKEKEHMAANYKARMARIPCKHFDGNLGSCTYGKDCFYAHLDEDGKDCKAQDLSMQQLYEKRRKNRNRRHLENDIELISQMLLMDMYAHRGFYIDDSDEDYDSEDEEFLAWRVA